MTIIEVIEVMSRDCVLVKATSSYRFVKLDRYGMYVQCVGRGVVKCE